MFLYRLFSHDGSGNFSLLREFKALDDETAMRSVGSLDARPLELWQLSRKIRRSV